MKAFWRLGRKRRDWDEEIDSHLAMRAEWNQQHLGLTASDSGNLAQRQFGSRLQVREAIEDLDPGKLVVDFADDLRHTLRLARRSPTYAFMVIGIMAAGITAATTIFSIVDPLLFRSLPFHNDKQLVSVGILGPIDTNEFATGPMYIDWRDHQKVFASMTAMRPGTQCDVEIGRTERIPCVQVERSFLPTLGVNAALGRNFSVNEDRPKAPRVALVSDRVWRQRLGADPAAIGKLVRIDDAFVRVIGVLPPDFVLPQGDEVDVLLPAQFDMRELASPQNMTFLRVFARLLPGMSIRQASEGMGPLFAASIRENVPRPLQREVHPILRSVRDRMVRDAKLASHMLLLAVALLMLMAGVTVANMLLARGFARKSELAMRMTLGASRGRLVRQWITETVCLCGVGGIAGFGLSCACVRILAHAAPGGFLQLEKARADLRAFFFSLAVSTVAALVCAVLPSLQKPSANLLRSWQVVGSSTARIRQALTTVQLACSLILLAGAILLGQSLKNLESQQPGFVASRLSSISLRLSRTRYARPGTLSGFYSELEGRLKAIPGVQSVAISDSMPPAGSVHGRPLANIKVAGEAPLTYASGMVAFRYVTPGYFATLQIPTLKGRTFTDDDRTGPEKNIVLSRALARDLFGSHDPVGQTISLNGGSEWLRVIGVVADVKNDGIKAATWPEYYRIRKASDDNVGLSAVVLLRSQLDSRTLSHWVLSDIATLDPSAAAMYEPMPERMQRLNDRPRFLALILAVLAGAGVLLAAGGLYGVTSFLVSGRMREIGVRAALGATRSDILVMVQRQMMWSMTIGIAVGLFGSFAVGRLMRGLLFEIAPGSPVVLSSAVALLVAAMVLAAWGPCWKATHVDPARALRVD